ncbi:N-acetylglucosamine-specific PTS transporter subunit IIBC [Anaerococcus sp.]|uniref:N-acetylglucosamine-specific PTS transporter subunit IIBC n=1 Tax=Anaerococcus sp. TaxID=1872515 RepID=UPI0029055C79|nr:N-acetylglucosamine-specific PTS transporter subunit IIBC [Anaerococcus sp.]MDU2598960.1 N-acetylglucosamine-specific PTS transporter subunit IIBC [Anaerococcus sp.]
MKEKLQRLGQSLMQPVAVMPLAALLLGIGYLIDPDGWGASSPVAAFLISAGGAILDNLGILFAVGVAFGIAKENHGASALAGLVAFLTLSKMLSPETVAQLRGLDLEAWQANDPFQFSAFSKIGNGNVLIGILSGVLGGKAYDRFHETRLPDFLAFFSGRRLVPIMASLYALIASLILMFLWPIIYSALATFGEFLLGLGAVGAGIYGFANRLLIPTGLHHALNQVFWFDLVGVNDIPNFLNNAQDTITATYHPGMYQAGFFPIMMFGLPGAALAMAQRADEKNKKTIKALMIAGALASFLTGVTEPLEFAFMFAAPQLYFIHALLTGISVFVAAKLQAYAGFGFSAGLIDFFLSSKNPMRNNMWILIIMGLVFFVLYYLIFKALIDKWDIATPGRTAKSQKANNAKVIETEDKGRVSTADKTEAEEKAEQNSTVKGSYSDTARKILEGLGGAENIDTTSYCTTRLRLTVKDPTKVNEEKIKDAGIAGLIKPGPKAVQVIIGPQVQAVHDEFVKLLDK